MEVTRNNFKESLPLVQASIDKADFLVIDAEFTGLINGREVSIFDSPEEYYITHLHGSSEFLLIQFGLCTFYFDEYKKQYMNETYNFYLFPRGRPDRMFLCQSSSLDFLCAQGFDFNKLIKEGISYMTETTESKLREHLTERQKIYASEKNNITIPDENKQQIKDICNRVRVFLDEGKEDELEIDRCNAFIRRLLFQELRNKFKNEVFVETKILENKDRVLKVIRITSANEGKDRDTLKREKEWEEFEDSIGFSKVARMISQSDKLVVGHNMLLDVMHTLNHFFQPLPSDYASFKEFAHCMFPRLLDTKYMSSLPPFKEKVNSSVLQHLLFTLSEPPFSLPKADCAEGRGYGKSDEKHHEAGYDAYVTGLCFLAMHAHLTHMRGERDARVSAESVVLKPFLNRLFLAKTAHQDSPYMNLVGADPSPSRDHVYHLTFPKEWQRDDINQLFSPFGAIIVQFLDDTSALVALVRRDQAGHVSRALASNTRVLLIPYAKYKHAHKDSQKDIVLRKAKSALRCINTTEARERQVKSFVSASSPHTVSVTPSTRLARVRSSSVSEPEPPHPPRKRTSSGVFQVDETEPPPKKVEVPRNSDTKKKVETMSNGRRTTGENGKEKSKNKGREREKEREKDKEKEKEKDKVVERFDIEAKSNCVTAFKESDSWE